jgi:hypothetical protein
MLRVARRKPNRKAGCSKACCDQSAQCSDPDDQGLHAGAELPLDPKPSFSLSGLKISLSGLKIVDVSFDRRDQARRVRFILPLIGFGMGWFQN